MEEINAYYDISCRLCLCKCEDPRNMLADVELAEKVQAIFPEIEITSDNGITTLACEYCHNLITQFYGYFQTVKENQKKLFKYAEQEMKKNLNPISVDSKPEIAFELQITDEPTQDIAKVQCSDQEYDNDWFDNDDNIDEKDTDIISEESKPIIEEYIVLEKTAPKVESLLCRDYNNFKPSFTSSFRCPHCKEEESRFRLCSKLREHIQKAHFRDIKFKERLKVAAKVASSVILQCDICDKKVYVGTKEYLDHTYLHLNIQPYKCECNATCTFKTWSKSRLREHVRKQLLKSAKIFCYFCKKIFKSQYFRDQHVREKHSEKLYICNKCGVESCSRSALKKHLKTHKEESLTVSCERCPNGIRFPTQKILELHMQRHKKEDSIQKVFRCHMCERGFCKEYLYKDHLILHKNNELSACVICGATIATESIRNHAKLHNKPTTYQCNECPMSFKSKFNLSNHIRNTHKIVEIPCDKCGKLQKRWLFKRHYKFCGGNVYLCVHCPMTFQKLSERSKHTKMEHSGFNCRRCALTFVDETQLLWHQRYDKNHARTSRKSMAKSNNNTQNVNTLNEINLKQ